MLGYHLATTYGPSGQKQLWRLFYRIGHLFSMLHCTAWMGLARIPVDRANVISSPQKGKKHGLINLRYRDPLYAMKLLKNLTTELTWDRAVHQSIGNKDEGQNHWNWGKYAITAEWGEQQASQAEQNTKHLLNDKLHELYSGAQQVFWYFQRSSPMQKQEAAFHSHIASALDHHLVYVGQSGRRVPTPGSSSLSSSKNHLQ